MGHLCLEVNRETNRIRWVSDCCQIHRYEQRPLHAMLPQVSLTPSLPNQEKTKYGTLLEVIYSNFVEEAGLSLTNHTLCYTLLSSEPNDRTWLQT